jgi:hypothetical protein
MNLDLPLAPSDPGLVPCPAGHGTDFGDRKIPPAQDDFLSFLHGFQVFAQMGLEIGDINPVHGHIIGHKDDQVKQGLPIFGK